MSVRSKRLPLVGLLFAVVAAVGYLAFNWQFGDGDTSPVVLALAAVAVAVAVGSELRSRL